MRLIAIKKIELTDSPTFCTLCKKFEVILTRIAKTIGLRIATFLGHAVYKNKSPANHQVALESKRSILSDECLAAIVVDRSSQTFTERCSKNQLRVVEGEKRTTAGGWIMSGGQTPDATNKDHKMK